MRNRARPDTAAHDIAALKTRLDFVEAQMRNIDMQRHVSWPPFDSPATAPFMQFSTCSVTDFLHPRYVRICNIMKHPFAWHRKLWEWVYVVHHLLESEVVQSGSRGLVFGVGSERLPAVFAQMGAISNTVMSTAPM